MHHARHAHLTVRLGLLGCLLALALQGCTVGPNFVRPVADAPADWTSWHGGDNSLRAAAASGGAPAPDWWRAYGDPVLDRLEQRAFENSPDLRTAALHFAQARAQLGIAGAEQLPAANLGAGATRERQSEYGASTRLLKAIGGNSSDTLARMLASPFTLYQAGFDASWEVDLWGRVRRSIEAARADAARQAALLDFARLSLVSEVARNYFELRATQSQIRLAREDIAAMQDRLALFEARVRGGMLDDESLAQQRAELAALQSQLPPLLLQESVSANQIALLLGVHPGALRADLRPATGPARAALPDLALGLPSQVARRRPDIRAAEARLHSATAGIGIAKADLYPDIRLGAGLGLESFLDSEISAWGSRTWSVGPSLSLPIFDHGRRQGVVQLRELQQQEAAVAFQRTVLQAWQEIDDALSGYRAAQRQARALQRRVDAASLAYRLAQARYAGGASDFLAVLDSRHAWLQARRDLAAGQGRLDISFVAVNKALGNAPAGASSF